MKGTKIISSPKMGKMYIASDGIVKVDDTGGLKIKAVGIPKAPKEMRENPYYRNFVYAPPNNLEMTSTITNSNQKLEEPVYQQDIPPADYLFAKTLKKQKIMPDGTIKEIEQIYYWQKEDFENRQKNCNKVEKPSKPQVAKINGKEDFSM